MGHPEIGLDNMKRFAEAMEETATVEKPAKMEGRNMLMFLAPKKLELLRRTFVMPKIKTHSGAKKRFKLSKNGKPMRGHAFKSHILNKRAPSAREISARFRSQTRPTPLRSRNSFPTK